jgi:cytochrome bd ubiquinol oxidase subunit II
MLADVAVALIVAGMIAYAVLGGADFGAGFWDLTAGGAERGGAVRGMIQRSMAPVWEANHVWLIFVLVVLWTAFPVAFGSVMSTLYVPLFIAVGGIIFRGTAFALRGEAATIAEARVLGALFALSSVLVPFCFGACVGAIAGGEVPVGNASGDPITSWLNPLGITCGVIFVLTGAYLAAVYLAADAARGDLGELQRAFRARALGAGIAAGVLAAIGLLVLRSEARELYDDLVSGPGLACIAVSAVAGIATLALVWRERYEAARYTAVIAVAAVIVGWAVAQSPYLLPGELTVDEAAAPDSTLVATLVSVALGMLVLVPSLYWLYSLTLQGRLDQAYEPLDQRFRPLTAADPEEKR